MNLNRRKILKNSAIGGGLGKLWAAPAISTIVLPAHAQSSDVVEPIGPQCAVNETDSDSFIDAPLIVENQMLSVQKYSGQADEIEKAVVTIRARVYGDGEIENRDSVPTDYTLELSSDFNYSLPFATTNSHQFTLQDSQQVSLPAFDGALDFEGASSTVFDIDTTEQVMVFELTDPADLEMLSGGGNAEFIVNVMGTFNAIGSSQQANATFLLAEGSVEVEYFCADSMSAQ